MFKHDILLFKHEIISFKHKVILFKNIAAEQDFCSVMWSQMLRYLDGNYFETLLDNFQKDYKRDFRKDSVDLVVGGPPCQGYSGI